MARIVESLAREGKRNDAGEKIVNSDESYAVLLDRVLRERPQGALLELCERLAVGYAGEDGIKAGVWYRVGAAGKLVPAEGEDVK